VSQVFPNNIEIMERSDFIELMQPSKEIHEIMTYVHQRCLSSVVSYCQRIQERILTTVFIRKTLLELQRSVYTKCGEIEELKKAGTPAKTVPTSEQKVSSGDRKVFHRDS
jgi:hypothetical protein